MNLKIRTKIMLIALLSLLLAIGINAAMSSYIITREYSDALQSQALVIGQSLALQLDRLLKYGIFLDEVGGFEKQCQEIVNEYEEVSYAMVVDTEGKIVFHNDLSQIGQRLTDPALLAAAKNTERQVLEVSLQPGEAYFDVTIPVWDSRERHVAAAKVGLSTRLVAERTRDLLLYSGAATLVSLGLAIVLLVVLLPVWVTRPLARLLSAVQEIGQKGVFATQSIETRSRDEVGQLASAFNGMAGQIRELVSGLEQRVVERTRTLEERSRYLQASVEVSQAASSILETEQLAQKTVELILERFDFYYVGLFLVDEPNEWAVLHAGTGEAGQRMLARGHRLQIGGGSMIGWCIANAQPRIAQVVEQDVEWLATAELPETRSEAALPLRTRGKVIGALTVQSDHPGVFDEAALAVLQIMADQVATAIENARLYAESQTALETARRAYGELSRQGWTAMLQADRELGFRFARSAITPAQGAWQPEMLEAVKAGQSVVNNDAAQPTLAIPLKVRDQIVGVLDLQRATPDRPWTDADRVLLQTLTEQLGVALESARLYQDTQRRAAQERLVGEVTGRIRETLDLNTVLQTAVREMGLALDVDVVEVRLGTEADSSSANAARSEEVRL